MGTISPGYVLCPIRQNDLPQQTERNFPMPTGRTNGQSLSKSRCTAKFLNSIPPRKQYCFRQDVLRRNCDPRHPKLGNGSENRCSFILGENTTNFAEPLKRASANLHLNFDARAADPSDR